MLGQTSGKRILQISTKVYFVNDRGRFIESYLNEGRGKGHENLDLRDISASILSHSSEHSRENFLRKPQKFRDSYSEPPKFVFVS